MYLFNFESEGLRDQVLGVGGVYAQHLVVVHALSTLVVIILISFSFDEVVDEQMQ